MQMNSRERGAPEGLLFAGLLLLYGVLINDHDLTAFNLQQMGVEAIVERGVFHVDGSPTPELQPGGDVFEHGGHLYAAKQPGQFFAGALVYGVLHALGLAYTKNYLLAAALVTFFTSALVTAAAAVAVFCLGRSWTPPSASPRWPLAAALAFAVGTPALPYSGVAHHDALASGYLVVAVSLACMLGRDPSRERSPLRAGAAGFLLGLTLTTSMLPFFMAVVVALSLLAAGRRAAIAAAAGGAAGLLPLLVYHFVSFGNPFVPANVVGNFSDTFLVLDPGNFWRKVVFYAGSVTEYAPIAWLGLLGLACFPPALRREQILLAAMLVALGGYVFNIETIGGCQYGPRYLLPAMPIVALGLLGFAHLAPGVRRWAAGVVVLVLAASAAINLVGALYGTMYCDLRRYAFALYLDALRHGFFRRFPLALWLAVPAGLWVVRVAKVRDARGARCPRP
jgi:hypothetical protein